MRKETRTVCLREWGERCSSEITQEIGRRMPRTGSWRREVLWEMAIDNDEEPLGFCCLNTHHCYIPCASGKTNVLKHIVKDVNIKLLHDKTMERKEKSWERKTISLFILMFFLQFTSNVSLRKVIFSLPTYYIWRNSSSVQISLNWKYFFPRKHMNMCSLDFQLSPQLSKQVPRASS